MRRAYRTAAVAATVLLGIAVAALSFEPRPESPRAEELPAGKAETGQPLPAVTLPPGLARVLTDYEAAWSVRDAAALARLFTEDGFVLPNGGPPVRGRAAIEKSYSGSGAPRSLALRAFAFDTNGAVGYIIGGYAPRADDPDTGKFTLTLRKGPGGRWLIVSDMDNPNGRPAASRGPASGGAP